MVCQQCCVPVYFYYSYFKKEENIISEVKAKWIAKDRPEILQNEKIICLVLCRNVNALMCFPGKGEHSAELKSDNIPTFFYLSASFHILTTFSLILKCQKELKPVSMNKTWTKLGGIIPD